METFFKNEVKASVKHYDYFDGDTIIRSIYFDSLTRKKKLESSSVNFVLDGYNINYYPNSNVPRIKTIYKNGKKYGKQYLYHRNGKIKEIYLRRDNISTSELKLDSLRNVLLGIDLLNILSKEDSVQLLEDYSLCFY